MDSDVGTQVNKWTCPVLLQYIHSKNGTTSNQQKWHCPWYLKTINDLTSVHLKKNGWNDSTCWTVKRFSSRHDWMLSQHKPFIAATLHYNGVNILSPAKIIGLTVNWNVNLDNLKKCIKYLMNLWSH
jgi:hypothetical protein